MVRDTVEQAFRRHYGDVFRFVRRRTGDDERARDLTQEVFADAAAALPDLDAETTAPLAWLYTVAKRRFADEARRRGREASLVERLRPGAGAPAYTAESTEALRAALARLTPERREIVVLKLVRGLSFAEIAVMLATSEPAAKMKFMRALRELRAELEKEGIER